MEYHTRFYQRLYEPAKRRNALRIAGRVKKLKSGKLKFVIFLKLYASRSSENTPAIRKGGAGLLILISLFISMEVKSQPEKKEYASRINIIQQNIHHYFYDSTFSVYNEFFPADTGNKKKYSFLWPLCGLLQAANETDAALMSHHCFDTVLARIQPYYDNALPKPGYNSYLVYPIKEARFYDDNQWIGIACMDAYRRTKVETYLQQGLLIYNFMMTGFDLVSSGGLYWKEYDYSTKNTCSNGPGALLALQLYKTTHSQKYLDTALLLYNWVNKELVSPDNLYYDNIQLPSGKVDKRLYTYNAGTMLQSSVLLYHITKDRIYLTMAKKIAAASLSYFYKDKTFPGNYWFNAVLLRGYVELYKADHNKKYILAMQQYGETIWHKERSPLNLIGKHTRKELLDQAAVMEIFASLAQLSAN